MISDDDLRRASQKWEEARLGQFPEPEACGFETTPKFERKMKKLIERTDHPTKYWLKKGLACFMLFFLLGGGLLSLNSEARAAFFGWTRKILGTVFEYRYTGEDASAPKNIVYLPSWIPDGFEIYRESYHEGAVMIAYLTKDGHLASFIYNVNGTGTVVQLVSESCEVHQVFVGEYPADLYLDNVEGENNALVWTDEERNVLFTINAPLSEKELIKMGESVMDVAYSTVHYLPSWIPDGFETVDEFYPPNGAKIYYENDAGQFIAFSYSMNNKGTNIQLTGDNVEIQRVQVGEYPADLYLDQDEDENNALVWEDENRKAFFQILGPGSGDELIKIAESIVDVAS